ncbi:MAG TPA: DUF4136 domain-containing protein [Cyclobacteriaceae bacterium]|nr:DUF4136 domain-containing protein [Cyclobacteriaceae bacterium]
MKYTILVLIALFASCSNNIIVHTDFDRSVEIHRLTNYSWLGNKNIELRNNPLYINELTDKRIKDAVGRELAEKGYVFSEQAAQVIVHYHIVIEDKAAVRTEPYGYFYTPYWMSNGAETVRYQEGTLIVDFMDTRNCNLIWRGWAVSVLDEQKLITEDLINRAVSEIFRKFPTSAVKEAREY